jgi:uncharacterized protein YcbX
MTKTPASTTADSLGALCSLWRYPVKSMMGEEVNSAYLTPRGLFGDRAYALIDTATGKIASAKNPGKWPTMFRFRAAMTAPPAPGQDLPPVMITLPHGETLLSDQPDADALLSKELGRPVTIKSTVPDAPELEEYWPDIEGLVLKETVTVEAMPEGTFFDLAVLHLLTTSTINSLRAKYPDGRFEVRRFRPNLVVEVPDDLEFAENEWIGKDVTVGGARLKITGPCPRCVMTTLPQYDLPKDPGILRTAAKYNQAHVGVYAAVLQAGPISIGDVLKFA